MLKRYVSQVSRTSAVVLGVLVVLVAVVLVAVAVSALIHHSHKGRTPVVTVPTTR